MKDKDLIKNLIELRKTPVRGEFLASLKTNLRAQMEFYPAKEGLKITGSTPSPFWSRTAFKFASLALSGIVLFGGGGAVLAARGSLPGDLLYPVKIAAEDLELKLAFKEERKAELGLRLAEKRLEEIGKIRERNGEKPRGLETAEKRLEAHLEKIAQIVKEEDEAGRIEKARMIGEKLENIKAKRRKVQEGLRPVLPSPAQTKAETRIEEEPSRPKLETVQERPEGTNSKPRTEENIEAEISAPAEIRPIEKTEETREEATIRQN